MSFNSINSEDYTYSRPSDPRLGDSTIWDNTSGRICMGGYPDDEGISINGGRPGASAGPDTIRKYFYKMTPDFSGPQLKFSDIGNLDCEVELALRHENAKAQIKKILLDEKYWVGLGGGHDYAYPDGAAFLEVFKDKNPLVINFDAHLDVRPLDKGISSGTPFFRLLNEFEKFDFLEVGIQKQCNSKEHIEWCQDKGGKILCFDEYCLSGESLITKIQNLVPDLLLKSRPTFISIDIDAFSSSFAMGCSQAWPIGLEPHDFFKCMHILIKNLDVRCLGIYEVSPPLDQDDRTSKLAAQILHQYYSLMGEKFHA